MSGKLIEVDRGRVDLGAEHNGRVEMRRVFITEHYARRFIVDLGRRVYVLRYNSRKSSHINYVIDWNQP